MARTLGLSLGGCDMCLKRLRSRGLVGKRKGIYPLQYKITESGLARLQYYQRLDVNQ
jgi:predicted transcriptional regulator